MQKNWILGFLAILFLLGSASAAFVTTEFTRSLAVPTVPGLRGQYINACASFTWNRSGTAADFNTYVVRVTSNNPDFDGVDVNTVNSWYTACTIAPGDWVKAVIYQVDGNASGLRLNSEPDANATVNPGSVTQAGTWTLYSILVAIGGLVALLIVAIVVAVIFKKTGFKMHW